MAAEYTKIFSNPYPNGWQNLPSTSTPIIAQALQQHTNTIINIENYLSAHDIPTKVSELINDAIPTKVSQLQNDVGYITENNVPKKVSDLQNDAEYISEDDIPKNLSEFNNDSGFINNAVNNLMNYFLKSETYSREEITQILSSLNDWKVQIVNELPTENISETTVYCIRKDSGNVQLANDYELNMNDLQVPNNANSIDLGDPVVMAEYVEDPYD